MKNVHLIYYTQIKLDNIKAFKNFEIIFYFLSLIIEEIKKREKSIKNIIKSPQEYKKILINKLGKDLSLVMIDISGHYFCQDIIKQVIKIN